MKSLMMLWKTILTECGDLCGTSTALDLRTAERRFEHEGLSFFTITLSDFASDFQKSLEQGHVDRSSFSGFRFSKGLPQFLGGFLDLVFDRGTGVLLVNPSVDAIFSLRQITLVLKKVEIPCNDARNQHAIDAYLQCEQEMKVFALPELDSFRRMTNLLWSEVLNQTSQDIWEYNLVPKHGPGATADKIYGNRKFVQTEWPERLEEVFPYKEYALPNARHHKLGDHVHYLEPGEERPVKVTLVPKTLKTPRIIAIEPTCMQYMQQALFGSLRDAIEGPDSPSFHRIVGFQDQEPNRRMALEGSLDGRYATIDLKEASDRVHNQLVRAMLHRFPLVAEAVDATRSRKADVFGKTIRLTKYASMGSALCFPIEAMVFTTVVMLGIEKSLNTQFTSKRDIRPFIGHVRVYGDDIVIPAAHVQSVIMELEAFGFLVNRGKTFWRGNFRESCGKEYYSGHDVSVVKIGTLFPQSRTDVRELESITSSRNQFYWLGMWKTARFLDEMIGRVLPHFPIVESTSPALGRQSCLPYQAAKMHSSLHSPLVRAFVPTRVSPSNEIDGIPALQKVLLKRSLEPFADKRHLERSGRPVGARIKLRWVSPF